MSTTTASTATPTTASPVMEVRNLHKWHAGVHALRGVSLALKTGEAVGLIGDNGAGKTTLISILSGTYRQDAGEVLVQGQPCRMDSPKTARQMGIETIHQTSAMAPDLSIARNLFMGREPLRLSCLGVGLLDLARMRHEAMQALRDVGLHLRSPDALIRELSGGQRQGVAIARAIHFKSRVLILDEPTNHLSVKETHKVLEFVRELKHQNITGIFISHNMHHVFESCDRIVAMARGQIVFDKPTAAATIAEVQELL